jgi:uncharacterized membrane protein
MSRSGSLLSTVIGWSCLAALLLPGASYLLRIVVTDDPEWTGRLLAGALPVIAGAVLAIAIAGLMSRTPVGLFATVLALSTTAAFLITLILVSFWAFFGAGSYEASRPHIGVAVTLGAMLMCAIGAALLVLDGRGETAGSQSDELARG